MKTEKVSLSFAGTLGSLLSLVVLVSALTVTVSLLAPSANASSLGPSNAQRRELALSQARHLLTLATVPDGATKLSAWISSDGPALLHASAEMDDPDQVDLTEFFLVPNASSAQRWLDAQQPRGGHVSGSGSSSGPGSDNVTFRSFSFPAANTTQTSSLQYSMLVTPKGELGLRVDAEVTWLPRKSPMAIVPSGAAKVVVVVNRGLNVKGHTITDVTSTSTSTIRAFLAKVNELPVANPGVMFCPADFNASVTLRFFYKGATLPYAVVDASSGGCGSVTILQYGTNASLVGTAHLGGGYELASFVARTLNIKNWQGLPG